MSQLQRWGGGVKPGSEETAWDWGEWEIGIGENVKEDLVNSNVQDCQSRGSRSRKGGGGCTY